MHKQQSIIEIIKNKKCVLSAEIIPPRNGADPDLILEQIRILKTVPVDFISVTKGAGGSLRGGTLPIAQMIKDRFQICSLAHFTCRDYTIEEIENNLMDHFYFGVHNILALRGDPPDGKPDHFKSALNRHTYAWQLVEQINQMNNGKYLIRENFDKPAVGSSVVGTPAVGKPSASRNGTCTHFCVGVAAHPEHEPLEEAVQFLKAKVDKGAQFAITQMIFSAEPYIKFVAACRKAGISIPIIPGLRILTQASTAERMVSKFGVKVPAELIEKLKKASGPEAAKQTGFSFSINLCKDLLLAQAPGIHIFVMNDAKTAAELLVSLQK